MAEKLLLHLQYECSRHKVPLPWDAIAHRLHPGSSGAAVIQHLNRLRRELIAEGHLVPPVASRTGPNDNPDPEIRGFVRADMEGNDKTTTRPVMFDEYHEDRRFTLPDAYVEDDEDVFSTPGNNTRAGEDETNLSSSPTPMARSTLATPAHEAPIKACRSPKPDHNETDLFAVPSHGDGYANIYPSPDTDGPRTRASSHLENAFPGLIEGGWHPPPPVAQTNALVVSDHHHPASSQGDPSESLKMSIQPSGRAPPVSYPADHRSFIPHWALQQWTPLGYPIHPHFQGNVNQARAPGVGVQPTPSAFPMPDPRFFATAEMSSSSATSRAKSEREPQLEELIVSYDATVDHDTKLTGTPKDEQALSDGTTIDPRAL